MSLFILFLKQKNKAQAETNLIAVCTGGGHFKISFFLFFFSWPLWKCFHNTISTTEAVRGNCFLQNWFWFPEMCPQPGMKWQIDVLGQKEAINGTTHSWDTDSRNRAGELVIILFWMILRDGYRSEWACTLRVQHNVWPGAWKSSWMKMVPPRLWPEKKWPLWQQ